MSKIYKKSTLKSDALSLSKRGDLGVCLLLLIAFEALLPSCKTKKVIQQTPVVTAVADTIQDKCKLAHKSSKTLTKLVKENELDYTWISAKADAETNIDGEAHNLDISVKIKKDSVMWISLKAVGGLVDVAKMHITKDSVKMIVYIKKQYFVGDFNYINQLLNADIDFELLQAALFGNSADFDDDDTKLKSFVEKENCQYVLSTERKRRLRRITSGQDSLKRSLQTMTLNPETFKILINHFEDAQTNRSFQANYDKFVTTDSVFAPRSINIDIKAEKKVNAKINYTRIEKNIPQKISFNIPKSYEPIPLKR